MPALRLVKAGEPFEARENVALRQMLARLTMGTHDKARGLWVLKPAEAQALHDALAYRTFSSDQLETVEGVIRAMDPYERDTAWDEARLLSLVRVAAGLVDHRQWIDQPIRRLHAAIARRARRPDSASPCAVPHSSHSSPSISFRLNPKNSFVSPASHPSRFAGLASPQLARATAGFL